MDSGTAFVNEVRLPLLQSFRRLRNRIAKSRNILPAALRQIGFAATAAIEHGTGVAHERIHVAGGVGGSSKDKSRCIAIA